MFAAVRPTTCFGAAIGLLGALLLSTAAPSGAEASETLDRISERGGINIGYREDRPPMSFVNADGKVTGYSIELCLAIAEAVKATLGRQNLATTFVPVTAENRFDAIVNGEIDILCGATTKTISRQAKVDFTDLTFVTGATLMSLADSPVPGIRALGDKKVAAVSGTTTIETLQMRIKQSGTKATIVPVETAEAGVNAVIKGEVAAFAADQVVAIGLVITQTSGTRFAIANELFSFEPFALAVQRNDADFRLIANSVIAALNNTGDITPIYQRWFSEFGDDVPDLIRALYVLMSTPE